MKLKVVRHKTEETNTLGSKEHRFTVRIMTELTEDESEILLKYGKLEEMFLLTRLIPGEDWRVRGIKGPWEVTWEQLKEGVEWSSSSLKSDFVEIPSAIQSEIQDKLNDAIACEQWDGEDVIEIRRVD